MMIIDTHSQLRTPEAFEGINEEILKNNVKVFHKKQEHSLAEVINDMDSAGVDKSVIVAVDAKPYISVSNDLVYEAKSRYPDRLIGFASVDPRNGKDAVNEVFRAVDELGMKGLKFIPHLIEMYPNDRAFYPVFEAAQEKGIPVLFHSGTAFHQGLKIKYNKPIFLDDVACDFPFLKLIIAHFGFPWYQEALALVQRHENMYFNIAGWRPRYIPEMVVRYMDGLLSNKVLFGSDHPLVSREQVLEELKSLNLKTGTIEKMLSKNPLRVLGIEENE